MEKLIKSNLGQWTILQKNGHNDALGIGPNKVKFDPGFDQKGFTKYVEEKADHMSDSGAVKGKPTEFNWHFEPNFELSKLTPIKKDKAGWTAWYDGEMHEWRHDHGDEKAGHFEKWAKNPSAKPLIVIEGTDGKDHIIDGHHRCAMAHIQDMKNVPIIYGRRKTKK